MAKIVITGANGFVGLHTVEALLKQGKALMAIDKDIDRLQKIQSDLLQIAQLDICRESIEPALKQGDKVLHLAAIPTFRECEQNPSAALIVNTVGSMKVLEACKAKAVERIVFSSTGAVYGEKVEVPIREDHPRTPSSIYGYTKLYAEQLIQYFGVPYIILRYGYIYGPGKLVGAIGGFINGLQKREAPTIYGGFQLNDFVSIHDIVQANILALETPYLNEVFNIGSGLATSLLQVYQACEDAMGVYIEPKILPKRPIDPNVFLYDITKARTLLNYSPTHKLLDGIKEVVKCLQ